MSLAHDVLSYDDTNLTTRNRLKSGNLSSTRRIVQKLWLDDSKFYTKWFAIIGTSDYEGRCKVLRGKGGQAWRA